MIVHNYCEVSDENPPLRKLRASGKLQQILTRYNLSDWEK